LLNYRLSFVTGINKIRPLGAESEADYFEDVLKNIKLKWWR